MIISVERAERLQSALQAMVNRGGLHRANARAAVRVSLGVVDHAAAKAFKAFPYPWGSTPRVLSGYIDRKGVYKAPRARWRDWASKKAALRYQTKKSGVDDFWYRSILKYENGGVGNPSTLSHLIEFGSWNKQARKYNRARKIKQEVFKQTRRRALDVLEKGLAHAVEQSAAGVAPGIVSFRKAVL